MSVVGILLLILKTTLSMCSVSRCHLFETHTIQTSVDGPKIHYGHNDNLGKTGDFSNLQTKIRNSSQHSSSTGDSSPFVNDFDELKAKALLLEYFSVA